MDIFGSGIPLGRYFGINVRMHFTFLVYAFYRAWTGGDLVLGLVYIAGLYGCILLHEFGHALAARWCDGEANDILLWPLGGLAFCRPAWHPTAHLITSAAGPFVTLVLAGVFSIGASVLRPLGHDAVAVGYVYWFARQMAVLNAILLLFNLIPAFPMDGGRILRDILWYWLGAERATFIAVTVSRVIAVAGGVWAVSRGDYWLVIMAVYLFLQAGQQGEVLASESSGVYGFSIRERLRRGRRQRVFRGAVATAAPVAFHLCAICGRTERDDPHLDFRVCTECADGSEYCAEHLHAHPHR